MTPWGVTTIGTSWEARMPGARWAGGRPQRGSGGPQGAAEARGGKVRACFSAGWGSFAIRLSLIPPPKSPGPLRCSPNDTPDVPTSLHPAAPPKPGPGCHALSPGPLSGFLTGSLLAAWPPTFCSPHTAQRIFPKCKSYHITLLLKPAKGCLSHLEENPKPSL